MSKGVLFIDSLTVRYDHRVAISKISIKLDLGKFHVIMGPNGGGKTTLIRAIVGLVPYEGKIEIDGLNMKKYLKKHPIGYLAQRGAQFQSFPLTVLQVVEMGRYHFKESKAVRKKHARQYLNEVKMDSLANRSIGELSGGQQQRVLIARALATESKLMIMDEPLTGMDPRSQSKFYEMIERIKERYSLTIIISSHDVGFTTAYAENVFCINKHLVPHDEAAKLLNDPEIKKIYGSKIRLVEHHHLPSEEKEDV